MRRLWLPGPRRTNGGDQSGIDFDCHRALQQRDGKNQTITAPHVRQDSFQPQQRTGFNSYAIAGRQKWPRLIRHARGYQGLYGSDLKFVYRRRTVVEAHNLHDTGRLQNRQPIVRIEAAEQVTWEQRRLYFLDTIGPPFPQFAKRKKTLIALSAELFSYPCFVPGPHLQCEPRKHVRRLLCGVRMFRLL